ncbi:MAG: hypothetical protein KA296_16515, partial [Marinobacter sp.]|nr:hypothetical protein [Marinobacter sp.]
AVGMRFGNVTMEFIDRPLVECQCREDGVATAPLVKKRAGSIHKSIFIFRSNQKNLVYRRELSINFAENL